MEKLSLGLFTGAFEPNDSKRYTFKARGAQAAVQLAQLVYNGASTIMFRSSEGYAEIANNYLSWTFHAPKNFKVSKYGGAALNCQYIQDQGENLTLRGFFELLANATAYEPDDRNWESPYGVEVAGWESAMRALQLAKDKVKSAIDNHTAYLLSPYSGYIATISNVGEFVAPYGTVNLFAQLVQWLNDRIQTLWDSYKIGTNGSENPLDLPASAFLDNGGESGEPQYFGLTIMVKQNEQTTTSFDFKFVDYAE